MHHFGSRPTKTDFWKSLSAVTDICGYYSLAAVLVQEFLTIGGPLMNDLAGPRAAVSFLAVALWLAPALAPADTLDDIKKRGELVFGGDAEGGGPYIFPRDDDPTQMQGFEIELARLLAAKLGVRYRMKQGQWEKLPDLLDR